jgi:GT2 family glycosyltransferase
MPARLSAAIVTYRPDPTLLRNTVASLANAALRARSTGELSEATLFLVDNGPPEFAQALREAAAAWPAELGTASTIAGHGNVGYGRANNLALARADSEFHLVLNPDVEVDADALRAGIASLRANAGVGLLAPAAYSPGGDREYLCKRLPSVWVLFLRGFAPAFLRRRFEGDLARYEMRDAIGNAYREGVPLASGCFLLARTELLKRIGGFDPAFFMYFEDYDLSVRIAREAAIAYEPSARIVHHGGDAARKGLRHVAWFIASAFRFFNRHGWRWR